MTHTELPDQKEYEERLRLRSKRRAELEPLLLETARRAKELYAGLRPQAQHVASVERDYPLRHQQAHAMLGGVALDYLMIAFGNNHDLILETYSTDSSDILWKFERSLLLEDLLSEKTTITENKYPLPLYISPDPTIMGIEVSTYRYPERVGKSAKHEDFVCNDSNQYAAAEEHIEAFNADLDEARSRFS